LKTLVSGKIQIQSIISTQGSSLFTTMALPKSCFPKLSLNTLCAQRKSKLI